MIELLSSLENEIVYFPVRHHSPSAAYFLRDLINDMKPAAVLIEGPYDFNEKISELALDHELPIAVYSYIRFGQKTSGAFYPFAEFSPEYQAVVTSVRADIPVSFIDLPFAQVHSQSNITHRYGDGEILESNGLDDVLNHFGVDDFNSLWDKLIESDHKIDLQSYLRKCHAVCLVLRASSHIDELTISREQFMAEQVRKTQESLGKGARILVVTGGFHSAGIFELLQSDADRNAEAVRREGADLTTVSDVVPGVDPAADQLPPQPQQFECGVTLTPFTDARLDAFRGYEAGLPSPGFYYQAWQDRLAGSMATLHETLMERAVESLRKSKQTLSTADLMVVKSMAQGLSALRGHGIVFRRDLLDGIFAAMVKDETDLEAAHPLLEELRRIFRGSRIGRLSARCSQPLLTIEINALLEHYQLAPGPDQVRLKRRLDLEKKDEREISAFLHKLETLALSGFTCIDFSSFAGDEKGAITETWEIERSDKFESDCVEAAVWGSSLNEAVINKLKAMLENSLDRTVAVAALLSRSCLMALPELSDSLIEQLKDTVATDQSFASVTGGMALLLELLHLERILDSSPMREIKILLAISFERGLWLLESSGSSTERSFLDGIWSLNETMKTISAALNISTDVIVESFRRALEQKDLSPLAAGGITGALYNLKDANSDQIRANLLNFSHPEHVGDYLTGLFHLSDSILKADPALLDDLDKLVRLYDEEQFLVAVPALRIAFTKFTPREKQHMVQKLLKLSIVNLEFDEEALLANMEANNKARIVLATYGLRGLIDD